MPHCKVSTTLVHYFVACSFSISPIMELSTFRVVITFGHHQNSTDDVERQTAVTFMSDNQSVTTAVVVATNQPANGSLCQIVSLEVYRGRRNITRIDHDGFFLSDEGMFRVYYYNLYFCQFAWLMQYTCDLHNSLLDNDLLHGYIAKATH